MDATFRKKIVKKYELKLLFPKIIDLVEVSTR